MLAASPLSSLVSRGGWEVEAGLYQHLYRHTIGGLLLERAALLGATVSFMFWERLF